MFVFLPIELFVFFFREIEADCGEDLSELLWGHFPSVELIPVLEHLLCIKTIYELILFEVFFYFVGKSKFIS